ncbi:MAG TPA: SRPBCC family protein [Saprospiraceae bacterium]|jgi:ligand-binding SRPBCC domain-containing protein|nr:SRPBCC family protein [Saprospiraceae bacterium]HMP14352.1 SRPBCC family protein [Saprospiraceae bacterium]
MKVTQKVWKQFVPRPLDEVWHFFSRPENLDNITPKDMSFEILSDIKDVPMYEGMIVRYRVSPFLGIKMNWVTEITHVRDRQYFIDEQRFGPYAFWHHQHHFEEQDGGVLMTDILNYKIPYGFIGTVADTFFVNDRIEQIFRYRKQVVEEIFKFDSAAITL